MLFLFYHDDRSNLTAWLWVATWIRIKKGDV